MSQLNFTFWNLQNFFDTDDDPISLDFAYTPENGWTEDAFNAKKKNLAAVLDATHGNQGIDLLAVCEIEKDGLLRELIAEMDTSNLKVVMDPSGTSDYRGIDVAMAYNPEKLEIVDEPVSHLVHLRYRTRDIFEVKFRIKDTGEEFVLIASHWPSRSRGKYESEPFRIAVAENIAYIVESHLKVSPTEFLEFKAQNDLSTLQKKWDSKVMVVGDFNDEPFNRSVLEHLKATGDLDRVIGKTNDIDKFDREPGLYRRREFFLYNACWQLLRGEKQGTFFLGNLRRGGKIPNRYQVLDQMVLTRGMLTGEGLRFDLNSVAIFHDDALNATRSLRPKAFKKSSKKGYSDHFPITAVLRY